MSNKRKLQQFEELKQMPNMFRNYDFHKPELYNLDKIIDTKGQWRSQVFKNDNPIVLELACGKGEYSIGLAQLEPDKNYIGIDLKGNRLWHAATNAADLGLEQVVFIRSKVESLPAYFAEGEVDEIWITFPDPFISGNINRRLTSLPFLELYKKVCKPGAIIHLKTDDTTLFDYTLKHIEKLNLQLLERKDALTEADRVTGKLAIKTYYEGKNISKSGVITYLKFVL